MRLVVGRFIPGNSIIHRSSPVSKILSVLIFTISVILSSNYRDYLFLSIILIVILLLSKIKTSLYLKGLKNIIFLIAFAVIIQLIYSGIMPAIESTVRIVLILLFAEILTFTTRPIDLAHSLEDILKIFGTPLKTRQELSMIMMIAIRFAPVMLEEVDRITKSQMARGAKIDSGKLWDRMKSLISITVPLMASAVRKSEEIALAMEVRRFKPGNPRSRYRVYSWGIKEWALIISAALSIVIVTTF